MIKISEELYIVAKLILSKRPETYVEQVFFDMKDKVKKLHEEGANKATDQVKKKLISDLKSKGVKINTLEPKLGKFKGHWYLSTCKLIVNLSSEKRASEFLNYLQKRYTPKFKFKKFENGLAEFNLR